MIWIIVGVVISVIILCTRSTRAYTNQDYPYMTKDKWKHTYSEEQEDGTWTTEHRTYHRDDPWRD